MLTKTILIEGLLYIGFLIGAIFFVEQSISEFMDGTTSYSESHEPILLQDLPTLTICFLGADQTTLTLVYGANLSIDAGVSENGKGNTITLIENKGVKTMFGLTILMKKIFTSDIRRKTCYMITSDWNGDGSLNMGKLQVDYHFKFQKIGIESEFWITSEDNSYGIVWSRWFDGTTFLANTWWGGDFIYTIQRVKEIRNLKPPCSENSYYKCLANRFRQFNFDNALGFTDKNGGKCLFKRLCSPFSLPFDEDTIPLCKTEQDIYCFQAVLNSLRLDQQKYCPRACLVREYELEGTGGNVNANHTTLGLRFGTPSATWDLRSDDPFKTVYKEYLTISGMLLVGNVGGMLGLFVGFSFMGTSEWLIGILLRVKMWMDKKSLKTKQGRNKGK